MSRRGRMARRSSNRECSPATSDKVLMHPSSGWLIRAIHVLLQFAVIRVSYIFVTVMLTAEPPSGNCTR